MAPYMVDWEHGSAVHAMQGNQVSSRVVGKISWISRVVAGTWGIFASYGRDGHSKLEFVQQSHDSCLVMTHTSGI